MLFRSLEDLAPEILEEGKPEVQTGTEEDTIIKIIDLEHEINRDIDWLVDLKKAARESINTMNDPEERLILELRYLCYKTWPEIAEAMGVSESTVYRTHGLALVNFVVPPDPRGNDWKTFVSWKN